MDLHGLRVGEPLAVWTGTVQRASCVSPLIPGPRPRMVGLLFRGAHKAQKGEIACLRSHG